MKGRPLSPPLLKRIGGLPAVQNLAAQLGAIYIRTILRTGRWTIEGGHHLAAAGDPVILAFWHGRLVMMPGIWPEERPIHVLISRHRDGELIARIIRHFGLASVRGSPGDGGAATFREACAAARRGSSLAVTPDGPRGPRARVQRGTILLARATGLPILPATFSAARGVRLRTWDDLLLPSPFSRGILAWGPAIRVGRNAEKGEMEAHRARLEGVLNALTKSVDERLGLGRQSARATWQSIP